MTRRRRHPRTLREDERSLWNQVAASTRPMKATEMQEMLSHAGEDPEHPAPPKGDSDQPDPIQPFQITGRSGRPSGTTISFAPPPIGDTHVHMDKKAFQRMKRGKLEPEGRIDLHGMTLERAHGALNGFITGAFRDQKRLVLVITGKGKDRDAGGPIPQRRGVLRHAVPDWLRMAPLGRLVLQITPASRRHGGEGAFYVYLRRPR